MSNAKEPIERAKEMLVYGPIGLAMYLRDTAPSFMKVFVARGRAEFDQQKRAVGDQLGQARSVGATTADGTAPLLRMVAEGIEKVRGTAEGALGTLSGWAGESVSWTPGDEGASAAEEDTGATASASASGPDVAASTSAADAGGDTLAIPGYDELSASQIVEHLEGCTSEELAAIRAHEQATRARATILGKIDQLEPPS